MFHHHSILKGFVEDHPETKDHISGLLQYSETRYCKDFKEAEALFEDGLINQKHISKLYRPNDLVVSRTHGQLAAFVVHDWPSVDQDNWTTINCWSFQTDASGFARKRTVFSIPPLEGRTTEIPSLVAYPMRYLIPKQKKRSK